MLTPALAIVAGLVLLVWSADRFIEGSASVARHFGMSPLLIGMLIVGFGTSAPEMFVSALSSFQGNPGIALGNAYGSNIANIGLILGLTALISPIAVHSQVLRQELPILSLVTGLAVFQLWDGALSRTDALVLLTILAGLMAWSIRQGIRQRADALGVEVEGELATQNGGAGQFAACGQTQGAKKGRNRFRPFDILGYERLSTCRPCRPCRRHRAWPGQTLPWASRRWRTRWSGAGTPRKRRSAERCGSPSWDR